MGSVALLVQVAEAMSSVKQLAAAIFRHGRVVGNSSLAPLNAADIVTSWGRPRGHQSRASRVTLTKPTGALAGKVGTAPRAHRSRLTICRDFGPETVSAVMRRSLVRRSRVLLCLNRLPPELQAVHRIVLAGVDAMLVETDAIARALREFGVPATRIVSLPGPSDLALFIQPPRARGDSDVYRIVHVGDLEPEAGVIDLLACVVAWADRNPRRNVEVWWSGEGCLRGVLAAQPLPANVIQQFFTKLPPQKLASMFLECDMLAVPALSDPWTDVVPEAVTAQLPVLGSSRSRTVVELVTDGVTGWVFDPFEAGAMARAVDHALNTTSHELMQMRTRATAQCRLPLLGLEKRIRRALRLSASEPPVDCSSLGFVRRMSDRGSMDFLPAVKRSMTN